MPESQAGLLATLRMLQLASPTLPVGAYSYSQGLEYAVEARIVTDESTALAWIEDALHFTVSAFEAPAMLAMLAAAGRDDVLELRRLNNEFLASRETAELRAETVQMGHSLARLLNEVEATRAYAHRVASIRDPSYPCAWACAAHAGELTQTQAHGAYLLAWCENQVMAAVKLVPLGQSAGQRLLMALGMQVAALAARPIAREERWTNFAPGLAFASTLHETQYTRLFRS